jgi:DNA repair exonuclease SbcCD ATPase subunit
MSAKQRRVNGPPIASPVQQPQPQQQQQTNKNGVDMTLPMVLQLLESRIRKLEQPKEKTDDSDETKVQIQEIISEWKEFQTEYDSRVNILVTEINQLKDIVLKLQAYTMDVNKTLLEERVHFMSEEKENIVFSSSSVVEE